MKRRYRIRAQVWGDHQVLAKEHNSYQITHPLQRFFAQQVGQPSKIYLHAEVRALIAASLKSSCKNKTLYVERTDEVGNIHLAKPCIICVYACIFFGIEDIMYSISNEETWIGKTSTLAKEYGLDYTRIKQLYSTRKHSKNASYLAYN